MAASDDKSSNPLFDLVIQELPRSFFTTVLDRLGPLYKEAYAQAFNNPSWDDSEAEYIMPHLRRALFEKLVRSAALSSGLQASVESVKSGGAQFTLIQTQHFRFTASHVPGPLQRVRNARFRQENSSFNGLLKQKAFAFMGEAEETNSSKLYGIVLHGPSTTDLERPGFLKIGFPARNGADWADQFDFVEILAAIPETEQQIVVTPSRAPVLKPGVVIGGKENKKRGSGKK